MALKNKNEKPNLLERTVVFLLVCAFAMAGYSLISEFISEKDKYFKADDPMSDVG